MSPELFTPSQTLAKPAEKSIYTHRNVVIDIIRIFTAFGIITAHVNSDTAAALNFTAYLSPIRVPFLFITALVFFIANTDKNQPIQIIIKKIWQRLAVPFLAWAIIYIALISIKNIMSGKDINFEYFKIFLYGIDVKNLFVEHLYFLPELIVMQILTLGIILLVHNKRQTSGLLLIISAVAYLFWGRLNEYYGVQPVHSIICYIVIGFYLAPKIKALQKTWLFFSIGLILILLAISRPFISYSPLFNDYVLSLPLGGLGLILITLNIPKINVPSWAVIAASTTYGVYLSHIMFIEALEFIIDKVNYEIYYDLTTKLIMTFTVFIISIIFTLIIRKFSLLRSVLLGEK